MAEQSYSTTLHARLAEIAPNLRAAAPEVRARRSLTDLR
jgi:hypothetical protein